jgi:hypothetical protein
VSVVPSRRLGPFVVWIHLLDSSSAWLSAVATLPRDKSAKRWIVLRSRRCDRPLRDGLGRRSARLGSRGIQYATDRQQESVQFDMVDVFTNASINTRNGLLGGKWKMAANVTEPSDGGPCSEVNP